MEPTRSSRKRRPLPLSGTLSLGRSQLFLHRTRSAPAHTQQEPSDISRCSMLPPTGCRSDTIKQSQDHDDMILIKDLCKKPKLKPEAEPYTTGGDVGLSRVVIKDLRSRRVYSLQPSPGEASSALIEKVAPKLSVINSDCTDGEIAELGVGLSSRVENENSGCATGEQESGELVTGFSSEEIRIESTGCLNLGNDEPSLLQYHKRCDGENGGNCSEKIKDFNEELVQTTPPDAEICGNSEDNRDEGKQGDEARVKDTPFTGSAEPNAGHCFRPKDDGQRNDSAIKSNSVFRPGFPGKLFKAPGSVSYRRLFPYLMDIMRDDSGIPKLGHCWKDEKDISGQEFHLPLSSLSQEATKNELKTDSCTLLDTSQSGVSICDALVAPVNELSYGDGSKLAFSHCLRESPFQCHEKGVAGKCLSVPSVKDKRLSESKDYPAVDFHCVKDVGTALHNTPGFAKATNYCSCTSEQVCVLNEECELTTPPDVVIHDNSEINISQLESNPKDVHHAKPMDATSTQENADEVFCLKTDKGKDSVVEIKSVPRPNLHRKLFKTPGSVSYRRMLPFLRDLSIDDYGTSKFGYQSPHRNDELDMHAKRLEEPPLSSQSQEASIVEHKPGSAIMHGTVESDALVNDMVNLGNELSHGNQPKLTSSQDLPELPIQVNAKVVHECLSTSSFDEHNEKVEICSGDKCVSNSKFYLSSVMVDFDCAKNVENVVHSDDLNQVQNMISRQLNKESPPRTQNLLNINSDVPNLTIEHQSCKEKGLTTDYDETKQFTSLEEHKSGGRYPSEGQRLNHLDPNMPDAEENETNSRAVCRSEDAVSLNHVSVSNEESRPVSEKIILEKSDMKGHGGDKAGSVLKGVIHGPRMPLEGSNNKNAGCVGEIRNDSESKTALILNHCSRSKLLKHAGSFNFKRLLPFLMNTMKDSSSAAVNDHNPKLQKCLDQTPLLSDSNGCFPVKKCTASSGTEQQILLHTSDLDNDSSSPKSQLLESQSSHDLCKVIQLPDEQVVSNGRCKPDYFPYPPVSVDSIDLSSTPVGPMISEAITREGEATSALPKPSVHSEVKANSSLLISSSNGQKPAENECCPRLSQPKVLEKLRVPAVGFKKGILKRNPRGCRGLCTCLNCVSFRLHAERAFEFSRNQYLDAEEVALDIIKELSHLRNLLDRSIDSVNDNPVSDGSQVKEACMKAFTAEQLARDRLRQMNEDLNIHCRIPRLQRPRVNFADHIEEKVTQPGK